MTPEEKRAKQAEYMRGWYSKNKEKVCASMRESRRDNPEKHRNWDRIGYWRHRDRELTKSREKRRAYRAAHPRAINESAFDEITEQSAYWAGFLMADGCISGTTVILQLARSDIGHVSSFASFLQLDRQPHLNDGMAVITASSRKLAASLARFGIVPRKTLTATVRGLESNRDFWRGVIDGDGSIHILKRIPGYPYISLVGSRQLMGQFRDYAATVLDGRQLTVHPHKRIWSVSCGGNYAVTLIRALYDGCSIALPRKLAKANEATAYQFRRASSGPRAYMRAAAY